MGVFNKMNEPVFLKESNSLEIQLKMLKEIEPLLNNEGKEIISRDIKRIEYGMLGEKNIAYELKNSHFPMYILHDIYLKSEDLSAQIDYLIFTKKVCFVVECKNLYGDICIDEKGNFIRVFECNGRVKKEGFYSPLEQNRKHIDLIRKIKKDRINNGILKYIFDKGFESAYKSIIVLTNPKTVINTDKMKDNKINNVVRADGLVKYILDYYNSSKEPEISESAMQKWAESFLRLHIEEAKDYTLRYEKYKNDSECRVQLQIEETDVYKRLKEYRLNKSREEKIKPYYIFNDEQLKDLIIKKPKTKEELKNVKGFGEIKSEKYGDAIINIIMNY